MGLIFKIIGFFWRLFWRLVWTAVLLFLILVGVLYFTNPSQKGVAGISQAVQNAVAQVDSFLDSQGIETGFKQNVQGLTEQLTDQHTNMESGARWDQASATIYIETSNNTFRSAYQDAIAAWNQTGAFSFQIVNNKADANIIATEMNDGSVSAAGEAESQTNMLTKRFTSVTVRLNSYYLLNEQYGYSYERIVNTAEHELGHAIGLEHNEHDSVMQSAGSYHSIQPSDIEAVRNLYAE